MNDVKSDMGSRLELIAMLRLYPADMCSATLMGVMCNPKIFDPELPMPNITHTETVKQSLRKVEDIMLYEPSEKIVEWSMEHGVAAYFAPEGVRPTESMQIGGRRFQHFRYAREMPEKVGSDPDIGNASKWEHNYLFILFVLEYGLNGCKLIYPKKDGRDDLDGVPLQPILLMALSSNICVTTWNWAAHVRDILKRAFPEKRFLLPVDSPVRQAAAGESARDQTNSASSISFLDTADDEHVAHEHDDQGKKLMTWRQFCEMALRVGIDGYVASGFNRWQCGARLSEAIGGRLFAPVNGSIRVGITVNGSQVAQMMARTNTLIKERNYGLPDAKMLDNEKALLKCKASALAENASRRARLRPGFRDDEVCALLAKWPNASEVAQRDLTVDEVKKVIADVVGYDTMSHLQRISMVSDQRFQYSECLPRGMRNGKSIKARASEPLADGSDPIECESRKAWWLHLRHQNTYFRSAGSLPRDQTPGRPSKTGVNKKEVEAMSRCATDGSVMKWFAPDGAVNSVFNKNSKYTMQWGGFLWVVSVAFPDRVIKKIVEYVRSTGRDRRSVAAVDKDVKRIRLCAQFLLFADRIDEPAGPPDQRRFQLYDTLAEFWHTKGGGVVEEKDGIAYTANEKEHMQYNEFYALGKTGAVELNAYNRHGVGGGSNSANFVKVYEWFVDWHKDGGPKTEQAYASYEPATHSVRRARPPPAAAAAPASSSSNAAGSSAQHAADGPPPRPQSIKRPVRDTVDEPNKRPKQAISPSLRPRERYVF